jgi:hypothetical protein
MDGDLDDVIDALQAARAAEQLAALEGRRGAVMRTWPVRWPTAPERGRGPAGRPTAARLPPLGAPSLAARARRCPAGAADGRRLADGGARRATGVPLAYLVGEREFHGLRFEVSPACWCRGRTPKCWSTGRWSTAGWGRFPCRVCWTWAPAAAPSRWRWPIADPACVVTGHRRRAPQRWTWPAPTRRGWATGRSSSPKALVAGQAGRCVSLWPRTRPTSPW